MKYPVGLCLFLGIAVALSAADIPFERQFYQSKMKVGNRPRQTPHTLIYARIQPYNLYGNYMQMPPEEKRVTHHNFDAYYKD